MRGAPEDLGAIRDWLLEGPCPAVTAQTLTRLLGRSSHAPEVVAARAASVQRGSVASILDGLTRTAQAGELWEPKYTATLHRLTTLADLGAPAGEPRILAALDVALASCARPDGGFGHRAGVSHLCVAGNLTRAAIVLGRAEDPRVAFAVEWLLQQQRPDGGWHCFPGEEPTSTLDSWQPLAAFAAIPPAKRSPAVRAAVARGVEFLLDEGLGVAAGYGPWLRIHLPRLYYYDVLLGLDLATALGDPRDPRLTPAVAWLKAKRRHDGRWALDATHPDVDPEGDPAYQPIMADFLATVQRVELEPAGIASRWATLAALRVLRRVEDASV